MARTNAQKKKVRTRVKGRPPAHWLPRSVEGREERSKTLFRSNGCLEAEVDVKKALQLISVLLAELAQDLHRVVLEVIEIQSSFIFCLVLLVLLLFLLGLHSTSPLGHSSTKLPLLAQFFSLPLPFLGGHRVVKMRTTTGFAPK